MPSGLAVVAEPLRWKLLTELAASDRRVGELTHRAEEPQNLVSYHLKVLRDAGLVRARRSSFDGRDTYYRVDLQRIAEVFSEATAALDPTLRVTVAASTPTRRTKKKVLFLCTGNSSRSQMAEAFVTHLSDHAIEAVSAGSDPKPVHPEAVRAMAAHGVDISANASKHLRSFARRRFDAVVTLCDKVREVCPEFPGDPSAVHWSVPDPSTTGDFAGVAADIGVRVRHLIARLTTQGGSA